MSAVIVHADNATVRFGEQHALTDFTGMFQPATISAVIGGDGAGKSTLLRALSGRLPLTSGQFRGLPSHRADIGVQPADSGVWRSLSVAENLEFVAHTYRIPASTARAREEILLERAGLQQVRDRLAGALSGGMRRKLGVILATLHEPSLVLLDEPTTGVDPLSRSELWALIERVAAEGATVVFATSYLDEAERASQLHFLADGRVLAEGTATDVIARAPGALWEATAPSSLPRGAELENDTWRRGHSIYRWTREASAPPPAGFQRAQPDLENASIALLLSAEDRAAARGECVVAVPQLIPAPVVERDGSLLVEVRGIVQRFGSFTALDGVSLSVAPGEIVGLLGGNGAGKTTLMRVLLGLETPSAGEVTLCGGPPSLPRRRRLGYVAQGLGTYPLLSATANLQFVASVQGCPIPDPLATWAAQWGTTPVTELPLGTRRLLACAAASLHEPELLVLDEPTSGMDALSRTRLWKELHRRADAGTGILVSTHYMQEAAQCDRLVILAEGRVAAELTDAPANIEEAILLAALNRPPGQAAGHSSATARSRPFPGNHAAGTMLP